MLNIKKYLFIFIIPILVLLIIVASRAYHKNNYLLTVVHVVDSKFESLSEKQIGAILRIVSETMKKKFNKNIKFKYVTTMPITNFYERYMYQMNEDKSSDYKFDIFNLKNNERLISYIYHTYMNLYTINDLSEFVKCEYGTNSATLRANAEAEKLDFYKYIIGFLLTIHDEKVNQLLGIVLNSGMPLLSRDDYKKQSLLRWNIINCKFDVVITNSLIVDDLYDIPPHTLVRGGVLFGVTCKSKGRYGVSAIVSTFPIISRLEYFVKERGYYKSEEELDMISYMLIHELFLSVFKYKEDYNLKDSPINPPHNLRIKDWYDHLKTVKRFPVPQ